MTRRRIVCQQVFGIEAEDTNIVLAVEHNEFVRAELQGPNRGRSGRVEGHADSLLSEDIDEAGSELGFIGSDGEEGLDGIVGQSRDLGVDAIAGELRRDGEDG